MKKNEFRIAFVATAFIVFCGWMSGSLWAETTSTVKPEALSDVLPGSKSGFTSSNRYRICLPEFPERRAVAWG